MAFHQAPDDDAMATPPGDGDASAADAFLRDQLVRSARMVEKHQELVAGYQALVGRGLLQLESLAVPPALVTDRQPDLSNPEAGCSPAPPGPAPAQSSPAPAAAAADKVDSSPVAPTPARKKSRRSSAKETAAEASEKSPPARLATTRVARAEVNDVLRCGPIVASGPRD